MEHINYRKITSIEYANFFKEIFKHGMNVIKENEEKIRIWIEYGDGDNDIYIKNLNYEYRDIVFDYDFSFTERIKDIVSYLKMKRTILGKNDRYQSIVRINGINLFKKDYGHNWEKYGHNTIITSQELHIKSYCHKDEWYDNVIIDYFDKISLNTKKKLHKKMSRFRKMRDIHSLISLWDYMLNSFNAEIELVLIGKYVKAPIRIITKKKLHMLKKHNEYMEKLKEKVV